MRQLTREDITKLPMGIVSVHIRLSLILESAGAPKTFMANLWPLKFKRVGDSTLISVERLTWATYTLELECAENGDLVCEDYLLQLYSK